MRLEERLAHFVERLAIVIGVKRREFRRWDPRADYEKDARVLGRDGTLYRALAATGPAGNNVQDPLTEAAPPAIWTEEAPREAPPLYRYNDDFLRRSHAAGDPLARADERPGMTLKSNAGNLCAGDGGSGHASAGRLHRAALPAGIGRRLPQPPRLREVVA